MRSLPGRDEPLAKALEKSACAAAVGPAEGGEGRGMPSRNYAAATFQLFGAMEFAGGGSLLPALSLLRGSPAAQAAWSVRGIDDPQDHSAACTV